MAAVSTVDRLQKTYGRTVAVDDLSFAVEEGEIFGILGPSGAGKATTGECVQGLRSPDGGTIRVLGLHPTTQAAELRQQRRDQGPRQEGPCRARGAGSRSLPVVLDDGHRGLEPEVELPVRST
jgi:ABC-2 type transport system ATP-binding protein